jgi:hypothetical protein
MAEQRNPYRILGVPVGANKATIENAYRRLARRYHPDLNADPDATARMQDINWARDVLLDPYKRYHWSQPTRSDRRPYAQYTSTYSHTRTRTSSQHSNQRGRPRQQTYTSSPPRATYTPRSRPARRATTKPAGCSWWLILMVVTNLLSAIVTDKPASSPHPPKIEIPANASSFTRYPTPDMTVEWQTMTVRSQDQLLAVWEVTRSKYEWALALPGSKVYWPAASPTEITVCPPGVPTINYAEGKCGYFRLAQDPHFTPDEAP